MADIEKVIEGLRRCSCNVPDACSDCPYDSLPPRICVAHLTKDALELLKEQEAVKIKVKKISDSGRCGRCPNCLIELNEMDYPSYCGYCGRAVKWDETN